MRAVVLPWPSPALSPNARVHYMTKHRATRSYRALTSYRADQRGRKPLQNPVCAILPLVKTRRRRDLDNVLASLKSALDGLTDSRWWEDDSRVRSIHLVPEVYSKAWTENQIVIIAAEEADAAGMAKLVEDFRGAVLAGNTATALGMLRETERPANGGPF